MPDDFGLRIGIEGEKQFKDALRDINQSFKVLGSEMQLVTSQFDKNDQSVSALTSRDTVLNKGKGIENTSERGGNVVYWTQGKKGKQRKKLAFGDENRCMYPTMGKSNPDGSWSVADKGVFAMFG